MWDDFFTFSIEPPLQCSLQSQLFFIFYFIIKCFVGLISMCFVVGGYLGFGLILC
jgi:hypothetical protein